MPLNEILDIKTNDIIAIIGSGGKTSLAYNLSLQNQDKKLVLTTSTKMLDVSLHLQNCHNFYNTFSKCKKGINLFGVKNKNSKISSLDLLSYEKLIKDCDIFIYEADGSKTLPLKTWKNNEPVFFEKTNKIIGVMPLFLLGKKPSKEFIHRYDQFLVDFNLSKNDLIDLDLIIKICKKMFSKAPKDAKKYMFFNRFNNENDLKFLSKNLNDFVVFAGDSLKNEYFRI